MTKPNVTAAKYGWPPIMRLAIACLYTARSRWTLQRAVAKGDLVVAGRQGRSVTFRKEDLDRWLLGTPVESTDGSAPAPRVRRASANGSAAAALERLRHIATAGER